MCMEQSNVGNGETPSDIHMTQDCKICAAKYVPDANNPDQSAYTTVQFEYRVKKGMKREKKKVYSLI